MTFSNKQIVRNRTKNEFCCIEHSYSADDKKLWNSDKFKCVYCNYPRIGPNAFWNI